MTEAHHNLARKYAQAFFNLYAHQLNHDFFSNLNGMLIFLKKNSWFYYYLGIANIDAQTKQQAIQRIGEIIGCCHHISLLINALLKDKRIELLDAVINQILEIYNHQRDVEAFTVWTSHELNKNEQEYILTFLRSLTNHSITATFSIDTSLICGIKIRSDRSFFERSISRQLKDFEQSLLQRVCL